MDLCRQRAACLVNSYSRARFIRADKNTCENPVSQVQQRSSKFRIVLLFVHVHVRGGRKSSLSSPGYLFLILASCAISVEPVTKCQYQSAILKLLIHQSEPVYLWPPLFSRQDNSVIHFLHLLGVTEPSLHPNLLSRRGTLQNGSLTPQKLNHLHDNKHCY